MKRAIEIVPPQLISKAADNSRSRLPSTSNSVRSSFRWHGISEVSQWLFRVISRNSSADNDKQMFVSELATTPNPSRENRAANRG